MDDYSGWRSMRELDEAAGLAKGSSFRAFKAVAASLNEGRDYLVLDHHTHAALASALHAQGRLYRSSVNPVLLSPATAERIAQEFAAARSTP